MLCRQSGRYNSGGMGDSVVAFCGSITVRLLVLLTVFLFTGIH
jgi:hypothetical protein